MKQLYDHQKLCHHKRIAIPQNIRLGEIQNELLNGVNPKLLSRVIISLKKEYMEEHDDILNTKEKKDHVQLVLDNILKGKYNFSKQNIEEGQKLIGFYPQVQINLPTQQRNFQCLYCKERYFKTNASLYSHYRSCPKKQNMPIQEEQVKAQEEKGLRLIKQKQSQQLQKRAKKIKVDIVHYEIEQEKKEVIPVQHNGQQRGERNIPTSTMSFESIFFEDN